MEVLEKMTEAVIRGKAPDVKSLMAEAVAANLEPSDILNEGLVKGMGIIGERFKKNEVYVPEVLIAARAMKAGMEQLRPLLVSSGVKPSGVAVIGTVKGDLHDIGKNLVGMMLEGAGFQVVDAGVDVTPEKFVELAKTHQANVIGVSALLTTTMTSMRLVVEAVHAAGLASSVKVMIGGAPVTQSFCDEIQADGYAPDAASAADLAKSLTAAWPFLTPERITPAVRRRLTALSAVAAERGQTLAQIALTWVLRDPRVTSALIGASHPGQIAENVAVVAAAPLSAGELARIDAAVALE